MTNLVTVRNLPHFVIYDLEAYLRYDFVLDLEDDTLGEFKFPDWPPHIIEVIRKSLPHNYFDKPSQVGNARSWANDKPFRAKVHHPAYPNDPDNMGSISTVIMDLNDCHGWTREQIADWLDTLDEQPTFELDFQEESSDVQTEVYRVAKFAQVVEV